MRRRLPLYIHILMLLIFSLLIFRKGFSYINIAGVFVIEAVMLVVLFLWILRNTLKKNFIFKKTSDPLLVFLLLSIVIYVIYNIIIYIFSDNTQLQNLIIGIYPIYILLSYLLFSTENIEIVKKTINYFLIIVCFSPLLILLYGYFFESLFGKLLLAGNTYIYAIAFLISLYYLKNNYLSIIWCFSILIISFVMFERATFLNIAFSLLLIRFIPENKADYFLIKTNLRIFYIFIFVVIFLVLFLPVVANLDILPIDINLSNIYKFFISIFSSDVEIAGKAGTRNHRLEMWSQALESWKASSYSIFLGLGYEGNVAETSFRSIHNGYISILYRSGLLGLFLFFLINVFSIFYVIKKRRLNLKYAYISLLIFFAQFGEIATGTLLDSPFTSFILYAYTGLSVIYFHKLSHSNNKLTPIFLQNPQLF